MSLAATVYTELRYYTAAWCLSRSFTAIIDSFCVWCEMQLSLCQLTRVSLRCTMHSRHKTHFNSKVDWVNLSLCPLINLHSFWAFFVLWSHDDGYVVNRCERTRSTWDTDRVSAADAVSLARHELRASVCCSLCHHLDTWSCFITTLSARLSPFVAADNLPTISLSLLLIAYDRAWPVADTDPVLCTVEDMQSVWNTITVHQWQLRLQRMLYKQHKCLLTNHMIDVGVIIIIIIIIKPRLTRHMSVTKEDESQARGHEIVYE